MPTRTKRLIFVLAFFATFLVILPVLLIMLSSISLSVETNSPDNIFSDVEHANDQLLTVSLEFDIEFLGYATFLLILPGMLIYILLLFLCLVILRDIKLYQQLQGVIQHVVKLVEELQQTNEVVSEDITELDELVEILELVEQQQIVHEQEIADIVPQLMLPEIPELIEQQQIVLDQELPAFVPMLMPREDFEDYQDLLAQHKESIKTFVNNHKFCVTLDGFLLKKRAKIRCLRIQFLTEENWLSRRQLAAILGRSEKNGILEKLLTKLADNGYLQRSEPNNPTSPNQKYTLIETLIILEP